MPTEETQTIDWEGTSGKSYRYWIHPIGNQFKAEPGNYIFAKEDSPGRWHPVYIGQTSNLDERFDQHHKMDCIRNHGATHIHAHLNSIETARLAEERDLISRFDPECNG